MSEIGRIVVRAPNWIGDAVLSLPAIRDLRRNFPRARIEVLAQPWVAEIYRAVREVDGLRIAGPLKSDIASLRGAFDLALLLTNSFKTALAAFAARIPERWGYARDGRGPFLTRRASVPAGVRGSSEVYYYRAMLGGLGLEVSAAPDASLRATEEWTARGREILGDEGPWLGINPGAAYGSAKQWFPDRFAQVAERASRANGAKIAVLGGPSERPAGERLAAQAGVPIKVLCGKTSLGELIGVISHLRLLLTNDSGPMHLASAQGVATVAVFGPTDWRETAPFGGPSRVVREDVECAPCKLRQCPIDHRCMERVGVERVLGAVESLWNGAHA